MASCYKVLSSNGFTNRAYRSLGNRIGARRRINRGFPQKYLDLGNELTLLFKNFCKMDLGENMLELGTGWVHWFSIFTKLFRDAKITLFDVWDNRQLDPLKYYVSELSEKLSLQDAREKFKTEEIIKRILKSKLFDDLYKMLNFQYVIEKSGSLEKFPDSEFNTVFSVNVLEHIRENLLKGYIDDIYRILKPGGYSVHIIDIADHYYYLMGGKHCCIKEYLKYSKKVWRLLFENKIQYINRIQFSEWNKLFEDSRFKKIYIKPYLISKNIRVHPDYENFDESDIRCYKLCAVYMKE